MIISDGNDTDSRIGLDPLAQIIRESEVLVYAVGIDASGAGSYNSTSRNGSSPGSTS